MLDAEETGSARYGGLSDASAVPETDNRGWEPAIVVDYPVEPSPESPDPEEQPEDSADPQGSAEPLAEDPAEPPEPVAEAPAAPESETDPEPAAEVQPPQVAEPAPRATGKRKRAAVPSWDEIMFGGPPRQR
jgi:hypothetical protein